MCSSLKISVIYFKDNSNDLVESKEKQPVTTSEASLSEKNDSENKENVDS